MTTTPRPRFHLLQPVQFTHAAETHPAEVIGLATAPDGTYRYTILVYLPEGCTETVGTDADLTDAEAVDRTVCAR